MSAAIQEFITRLKEGETFEELLRSLVPRAEQDLLIRCATVRIFDERMVNEVFRAEVSEATPEKVPFAKLQNQPFVEPAPGADGFYQLRDSAREEYFELWRQPDGLISPELSTLSEKLVRYYETLGPEWELDVLYQLIPYDCARAEERFKRLYDEADSRFDLGRCQDLLKILEARLGILSPGLKELFKEQRHYLKARGLWGREYYQTTYYYEIDELKNQFQDILQDESKWILQLYARGGLGKTMFLRWLIARRCVPQPAKIPCARIDFDFIDPVIATENPSILLLEIAQQLNEQIPGNIFSEALGDLKEFRPIFTRSDSSAQDTSRLLAVARRRAEQEKIPERFIDALKSAALKNRVVVIFDTLEEVIMNEGTNMMSLLSQMKKLRDGCPGICLILSGRYDLTTKLEGFKRYDAETQTLELQAFSDRDARRYLMEKRGITRLLDPVIKRAQGNPFQLSLYADILRTNPRITSKEIEAFPPGLLYLIKRIFSRIPNRQVRWLLRYGVVPRKLRLSFVQEVMAPYLPHAMAGQSPFDDPKKDIKNAITGENPSPTKGIEQAFAGENPFQKALKSPREKVDVKRLWQKLTQYASSNSWVSPDKDDDTLSFHPEVLKPMRLLLRNQTIFRRLHRAAIRYYQKQAKSFPGNAGPSIQEAVYHKFQLDGAKAGAYWRKQLSNPLIAQRREWVQALGRDLVNLTAQTAADQPSANSKESLVLKTLRCEGYFEIALANVEIARAKEVPPQDVLWQEAGRDYRFAAQLQSDLRRRVMPRARMAYVQAAILISQRELTKAHDVLKSALKLPAKSEDKIKLEVEYADSLSRHGKQREAVRHYRRALKLALRAKLKSSQVIDISRRLATHYEQLGEVNKAIEEYRVALLLAVKSRNTLAALELARQLAETHLVVGQVGKATYYATITVRLPDNLSAEDKSKHQLELLRQLHIRGRIKLETRDYFGILNDWALLLSSIEKAMARVGADIQGLTHFWASTCERIGLVHGELMDISRALDLLEQARGLYKKSNDDPASNRCLSLMVRIQLRFARNIKAARLLLDQVDLISSKTSTPATTLQELVRITVLDQAGRQLTAQRRWRRLTSRAKQEKWPAAERAKIALAGVTHRARTGLPISLRESVAALRHVKPPSRRLALLDDVRWCPTPKKVSGKLSTSFANLLPAPDWKANTGAFDALTVADALRVIGKKRSPQPLLLKSHEIFTRAHNLFGLVELYRVWDRLGWPRQQVPDVSNQIQRFLKNYSNYPQLCLVVHQEHARRLLKFKEFDLAHEMLRQGELLVDAQTTGTYWTGVFSELSGQLLIERFWSTHDPKSKPNAAQQKVLKKGLVLLVRAKSAYRQIENRLAYNRLDRYANVEKKRLDAALAGNRRAVKSPAKEKGKVTEKPAEPVKTADMPVSAHPAEEFARVILGGRGYSAVLRRAGAKALTVIGGFAGGPPLSRKVPVGQDLSTVTSTEKADLVSRPFASLFLQDWPSVATEMLDVLTDDLFKKTASEGPSDTSFDFALDIDDLLLAGVPWEFVLAAPGSLFSTSSIKYFYRTSPDSSSLSWAIRFLQLALQKLYPQLRFVDGFYGPQTVQLVQQFQRENNLPVTGIADDATFEGLRVALAERSDPKRVLIVQPSSERQILSGRGHKSGGVSLESEYSRHGFKVEVLDYPSMSDLARAMLEGKLQTIHLCPMMKRSRSIGIDLDFESYQFSLSAIGKLLDDFNHRHKFRPLVILDVPNPPVFSEAVTQLMLRNAFASELFRMGSTSAILATGLAEPFQQQRPLTQILISSLAENLPFGETVNRIRKMAQDSPVTSKSLKTWELGPSGTALFTQDPHSWLL